MPINNELPFFIFYFMASTLTGMPFLKKIACYTLLCLMLSSCDSKKDKVKTGTNQVVTKDGIILTNNISLRTHDIKLKKATLLFDDHIPVPDDNSIDLGQKLWAYFYIDSGWKIKDDRIFLGASEAIYTDDGQTIVDEKDLFAKNDSMGLDLDHSKIIKLSTFIKTEDRPVKYYKVMFRVWDKNGDAEIAGHYNFIINH
jgi:hypothetical protein